MNREAAKSLIRQHEGVRNIVYNDTEGIPTIGVGFNLRKGGAAQRIESLGVNYNDILTGTAKLTDAQVEELFDGDFNLAETDCNEVVSSFSSHPDEVQSAIVDMMFNLGETRFRKFQNLIAALQATPPDYAGAMREMLDSKWARQGPNRAADDVALIEPFGKS